MYGRENILEKKFLKSVWGRDTPHRPIFLPFMEPTLKSVAILMKFTQDVCMDEKISWTKHFYNGRGEGGGVPPIDLLF